MKGTVFNIQRFSIHDGPGIRTTVFFKGCNLRCAWCHNPESYRREREIRYQSGKCTGCGSCARVCPVGVYVRDGVRINAERCVACGRCAEVCLNEAVDLVGREYSVGELMEILRKDERYYANSGGGVTLSGGEVMLQAEFAAELARALKAEGIGVAIDTAGNVPFEKFELLLPHVDRFLYDLKIMDSALHERYTGVPNDRILANARRLLESGKDMEIRVPVVAGINDSKENLRALLDFVRGYGNVREIRLLPYHDMGVDKAASIGLTMQTFRAPDEGAMEELNRMIERESKGQGGE